MKFLNQKLAKLNKQQMIIMGLVILLLIGVGFYLLWQKYKAETAVAELEPPMIFSADSAIFGGAVKDKNNQAIASVQIVLEPFVVTSANDGSFLLTGITPGYYPITFFKDGKQLIRQDATGGGINISGEASAPYNFVLVPKINIQTAITKPVANAYVAGTIQVEATASGATISKVEFLVNGAVKSTQTATVAANTYRASIDTKPLIIGDNVLQSKAYGADGSTKLSESVHILVDNELPTAWLTAPTAGTTVTNSFTVKAQLNDRYLKDASAYLDTTKIPLTKVQPIFGAPYYTATVNVSQVTEGLHPLKVVAIDKAGNKNTEIFGVNKINVNVSRVVKTVSITAPDSYAIVPANSNVNFAATTSTGWTPAKVEFYTPIRICVDTTAPYQCTWSTGGREYSWSNISVVAYDSAGNAFRANRWVLVW